MKKLIITFIGKAKNLKLENLIIKENKNER